MRKQPLTPDLEKKKESLLTMGENIRICKRQIIALQNEFSETKSDAVKVTLLKELRKLCSRRKRMSNVYRYCHVAYSELRGTPREKIEARTPRAKALNETRIASLK